MADESSEVDPREIGKPALAQTLSQAKTWLADGKQINLLSLSMAELRTLRAERKAARDQAVAEALLLAQLARTKGETYDAAAGLLSLEFVFSSPEFARQERLDEARALPKTRITPNSGRQMPVAA